MNSNIFRCDSFYEYLMQHDCPERDAVQNAIVLELDKTEEILSDPRSASNTDEYWYDCMDEQFIR